MRLYVCRQALKDWLQAKVLGADATVACKAGGAAPSSCLHLAGEPGRARCTLQARLACNQAPVLASKQQQEAHFVPWPLAGW